MATFIGTDILTEATVSSTPLLPRTTADRTVTEPLGFTLGPQQTASCERCITTIFTTYPDNFMVDLTTGSIFTPLTDSSFPNLNSSVSHDVFNASTPSPGDISARDELLRRFLVGVLSVFLAVSITVGNTLVILAVYRERHLRTVTNFFIVSLACADFLIGTVVLPFSIHMEITRGYWPYGAVWCDLWHAFDILGCTASILNLCVIACDRYWAITHPISYPTRMTKRTAGVLIGVAWVCSALISFPCIWWWHAVEPPHPPLECIFPSNTVYLIASSCVSFYVPSVIMVFMYLKIYRTAVGQVRAIRSGTKRVKSVNGDGMAMRVHKGGIRSIDGSLQKRTSTTNNSFSPQGVQGAVNRRNSLSGKKFMSRLSREHKAARTLGIVMGVFIICWLPFFIVNVTAPVCQSCYFHPIIIGVVTWLGYVNSALNPIIYAFASRRFKHAFARILCPWRSKNRKASWSKRGRSGSVVLNGPAGAVADTSLTQYSEERLSADTSSSVHSNLKYTLPYIYF